ncbi:MAG: hypothetical protein K0S28_1965, partial [Paucimonas sp.]|nr:hypothetical protein [Paucimonas sp.]
LVFLTLLIQRYARHYLLVHLH